MKTLLPLLFFLSSFSLSAQDVPDPNAEVKEMGLDNELIEILCSSAAGKMKSYTDWGIPVLMEIIYEIEGKPFPDYPSPEAAKADFAKWWDEKYSKCVCNMGPAQSSTLDAIALYNEQDNWVFSLYNPNGAFRADINRIMYLSHQQKRHAAGLHGFYPGRGFL